LPVTNADAENGASKRVVVVSPPLEINLGKNSNPAEVKVVPSGNATVVKITPQPSPKTAKPEVLQMWRENHGGDWMGADASSDTNAFFATRNWETPASPRSEKNGYDLNFSGADARAQASSPLGLLDSSTLIINDGASLDFNNNAVHYSGKAAIIVDSAYLQEIGIMKPVDKTSTLDLIITNNAVINGAANADVLCDFGGGSLLISDSTCSLSSLVRGKLKITGYGSVEVSSKSKDVINESTIDLESARAQFRFVNKPVDRVISEDLDKFSVAGALPIYGSNPARQEAGDNILIRDDGGAGTTLTVVK